MARYQASFRATRTVIFHPCRLYRHQDREHLVISRRRQGQENQDTYHRGQVQANQVMFHHPFRENRVIYQGQANQVIYLLLGRLCRANRDTCHQDRGNQVMFHHQDRGNQVMSHHPVRENRVMFHRGLESRDIFHRHN